MRPIVGLDEESIGQTIGIGWTTPYFQFCKRFPRSDMVCILLAPSERHMRKHGHTYHEACYGKVHAKAQNGPH